MVEDALRGNLAEDPLDTVLASLADTRRAGVLRIGSSSEIWLDEGMIYLVMTPSAADPAALLFGGGEGSIAEISSLLAKQDDVAGKLADRNPDAARSLERLVHEHNLNLLFELLVPSDASHRFDEGEHHPLGSRFKEPTKKLVDQAKRRLELWSHIASRIPSTAAIFRLSALLPDQAEERIITADEWRYLSLLDGRRSVSDVITTTQGSAFRVCSALYRLLLEGLIEEQSATHA